MLKTHQIDTVYHSSKRSEFKLRGKVILSDLRLCDIASTSDVATSQYLFNGGCLNLIKQVTLTSNGQTVDVVRQCNKWIGFKNLNRSTESMTDLAKYLNGSKLDINTTDDSFLQLEDGRTSNSINGSLNLNRIMPYLSATGTLCFDDLRLVIEWHTNISDVFISTTPPASFTVNPPTLIYDEYLGKDVDDRVKQWRKTPVFFNGVENDRIHLGTVATDTLQRYDGRIRAFDDKFLRNVVIMTDNSTPSGIFGHTRSTNMHLEKWNLRVNGSSLLPIDGINNPNTKIATLDDWGKFFCIQSGQYPTIRSSVGNQDINSMTGQFSYLSLKVNDVVNQLDLVFQRGGGPAALPGFFRDAVDIYVFGLVARFVQWKDGRLFTGYAK